jgi:hypothetical protein
LLILRSSKRLKLPLWFLFQQPAKASQQLSSQEKIPTLTVCEALSHASQYDGKLVLTSDRVSGTDEYTAFQGEGCPAVLITDGKVMLSNNLNHVPETAIALLAFLYLFIETRKLATARRVQQLL